MSSEQQGAWHSIAGVRGLGNQRWPVVTCPVSEQSPWLTHSAGAWRGLRPCQLCPDVGTETQLIGDPRSEIKTCVFPRRSLRVGFRDPKPVTCGKNRKGLGMPMKAGEGEGTWP